MSGAAFEKLLKQIAGPALTSGALNAGVALLGGASPGQALMSGLVDAAASGAAVGTVRKLDPKAYTTKRVKNLDTGKIETIQNRSGLETPVNIVTSLGTGYLTAPLIYGGGQQEQIAQQLQQRSVVNQLPLQQELANLSPGTMSQVSGAEFERFLNQMPRNSWMKYLDSSDQAMLQEALNPRLM